MKRSILAVLFVLSLSLALLAPAASAQEAVKPAPAAVEATPAAEEAAPAKEAMTPAAEEKKPAPEAEAAEAPRMTIKRFVVARGIEDHEPVGVSSTFPKDVGKVYCYMEVLHAGPEKMLTQVWYYNDEEITRVDLRVKGNRWRTYGYKTIDKWLKGPWRVDLVGPDGKVLDKVEFKIE